MMRIPRQTSGPAGPGFGDPALLTLFAVFVTTALVSFAALRSAARCPLWAGAPLAAGAGAGMVLAVLALWRLGVRRELTAHRLENLEARLARLENHG